MSQCSKIMKQPGLHTNNSQLVMPQVSISFTWMDSVNSRLLGTHCRIIVVCNFQLLIRIMTKRLVDLVLMNGKVLIGIINVSSLIR